MTSYNGKSLTYDAIGNPLTYGTYSYEWAYGRRLSKIKNGSTDIASFQYNDEGIRTVKIANGVRHEYDVVGGRINREVIRDLQYLSNIKAGKGRHGRPFPAFFVFSHAVPISSCASLSCMR